MARFREALYQPYVKRAQELGITRSRLMWHITMEYLGKGPDLYGENLKNIDQGIYQLGGLGRNLNQQIRAVHSGQMTAQPVDSALMVQIKERLDWLIQEWIAAVKRSRNGDARP